MPIAITSVIAKHMKYMALLHKIQSSTSFQYKSKFSDFSRNNFFCKIIQDDIVQFNTEVYSSFVRYLYQSGYYSYLIKTGFGLGENTKSSFALFN